MDQDILNTYFPDGQPVNPARDDWATTGTFDQVEPIESTSTVPSSGTIASFAPSTVPTNASPAQSRFPRPTSPANPGAVTAARPVRQDDGPSRKRQRVDVESPALDSVDYWLRLDDDDWESKLGGSFEIDFSKRQNPAPSMPSSVPSRPMNPSTTISATPGLGSGLYSTPSFFKEEDFFDDAGLDHSLSDDEEAASDMLGMPAVPNVSEDLSGSGTVPTVPAVDMLSTPDLYLGPMSWGQTQQMQPQPAFGAGSFLGGSTLSEAEQRRLLAIAMNTGRTSNSFVSGLDLGFNGPSKPWFTNSSATTATTTAGAAGAAVSGGSNQIPTQLQRSYAKPPPVAEDTNTSYDRETPAKDSDAPHNPASKPAAEAAPHDKAKDKSVKGLDRTAHNDIERKYRTNLKDKIAELRDAVPSLRSTAEDGSEETEAQRAAKISKGMILMKATEYIQYLERRNKAIMIEHRQLVRRLQAFEQLMTSAARQSFLMPNHSMALFDPRGFC